MGGSRSVFGNSGLLLELSWVVMDLQYSSDSCEEIAKNAGATATFTLGTERASVNA